MRNVFRVNIENGVRYVGFGVLGNIRFLGWEIVVFELGFF